LRKLTALHHTALKSMKHVEPAAAAIVQPASLAVSTMHGPHGATRRDRSAKASVSRRGLRAVHGRFDAQAGSPGGEPPMRRSSFVRPKLGLLSLVAATFFVVSGGPYGLEEIVGGHGYLHTLALLMVVPLVWSLPIALLVGELGSTLPQEGGYYAWVRRAMGPFWGMQVAWLALAMSLFDMAIYPTLLVTYLGRLVPSLQDTGLGRPGWLAGVGMIALCALWNLRGSRAVGKGSVVLAGLLLLPFVGLIASGIVKLWHADASSVVRLLTAPPPGSTTSSLWVSGVLLCMWNYMGWDNASTVAADVDRPQRTYPRAMGLTVALVAGCYLMPVLFAVASNMPAADWTSGAWVEVARHLGGPLLAVAVAVGGALCGLGMFNTLVLAYSKLPLAMAHDGLLPRWLGECSPRTGAPVRIVLLSAVAYAVCMGLGFRKLVEIDVILYGAAISLQFVALIVLRVREPNLMRPFRIPGGVAALFMLAALPIGLLGLALWAGRHEPGMWGLSSIELGAIIAVCGPLFFALRLAVRAALRWQGRPVDPEPLGTPEADTAEHAALSIP
jgi:amino acid transporter